ncbi:hypothetical protein E4U30_008065, partial [Claviceps sp. LM220 group G6]
LHHPDESPPHQPARNQGHLGRAQADHTPNVLHCRQVIRSILRRSLQNAMASLLRSPMRVAHRPRLRQVYLHPATVTDPTSHNQRVPLRPSIRPRRPEAPNHGLRRRQYETVHGWYTQPVPTRSTHRTTHCYDKGITTGHPPSQSHDNGRL